MSSIQVYIRKAKCPDCEAVIEIKDDAMDGEIYSCSDCGLELEYKSGSLLKLSVEKEDWGE